MGNSYSVAQEEQEEAEFERLVRAVERAQRGSPGRHDLEAQYDVPESQERPPRPEKVMVWFRGRRGNRVTEPEAQTVPSPTARMQSAPIIHPPDSVALGQTCPAALHKTPSQPSSPSLQTTAPLSPPVTTEDSLLESAGAGSGLVGVVQPATTQSSQHDGEEHDNADKYSNNSNTSVDPPPSFKLRIPIPSAVVQAIPVASEHQPPVDHAPPTVGHPPSTMITLPAPILERPPSQSPSPRVQQPPFELRPGSRSRSREDVNSRHRSRSRGPFWPLRDSLTDFKDLFYRPVRQHGRSRSPDVSRGRSPAQRPVQSQHTPPTAVTLSETSKRLDEASHRYLPPSRSPSLVHRVHLIPSSHSRRRSRSPSPRYFQYPAGSRSRSPREPDVVPHDALPRPPPRCREPERYSSRSRSPAQRSVQSQHRARRPPSPQDSVVCRSPTVSKVYRRSGSRTRSPPLRARSTCSRSPSPVRRRSRSNSRSPIVPRGVRHYFTNRSRSSSPCRTARDYHADRPSYEDGDRAWRRRATDYSRSPPPAHRPVHSMYHAASVEYEEVSPGSPRYRRPCTPRPKRRSLSPRPQAPDDALGGGSPRIRLPVSVYHFRSRSPPSRSRSPVRIIRPPGGPGHSTRSDSWGKFEQLLQLHETTLQDYERRAGLWHEHNMQLAAAVHRLEKHLVALRWQSHGPSSSVDSLPLSIMDAKLADEKGGAGVQLQSLAHGTGPVTALQANLNLKAKPYPSRPYAAGLPVRQCSDDWPPKWAVFPLKAFRGSSYTFLRIDAGWDDAALLRELGRSYDKLRTFWRKWFSLRSVRSMSMVYADHTCVYPRRIGPAGVSPSKNMRLRYFLHNPDQMKGRHEFMQVLTARTDLGIEFVEGWQLSRIAVAILLPVLASLVLAVLYSTLYGDVSGAFTIAGYMTSAYSVCLVLLGLLNFVEF